MYDFEGKVIYATEFNLVILDQAMTVILKEVRSFEPLRKSLSFLIYFKNPVTNRSSLDSLNRKAYDPYSGPLEGLLVGRETFPEHHRLKEPSYY